MNIFSKFRGLASEMLLPSSGKVNHRSHLLGASSSKGSNCGTDARQPSSRKNSVKQTAQFGCLQATKKQKMLRKLEKAEQYANTENEQYEEINAFTDKPP